MEKNKTELSLNKNKAPHSWGF